MDFLKGGSIAGGAAFLIALYIIFVKAGNNAAPVAQGFANAGATLIKTLQGNG